MACAVKFENYNKLQQHICHATQLIKTRFACEWRSIYAENWQDSQPKTNFIRFVKSISNPNRSQKELLKIGNSQDWDVSLFFVIFNTPPLNDSKYFQFIKDIKDCRNKVKLRLN